LTFSCVCVGYIFFRANDTKAAFTMLRAIGSPHLYHRGVLPWSLYVLVLASMGGYFAVIGGGVALERLQELAKNWERHGYSGLGSTVAAVAHERWVWIVPVVIVLALYLSVIFQPGHANTETVMYAVF